MKTAPTATFQEVWAAKDAAVAETAGLKSAHDFFAYVRNHIPDLGLKRVRVEPGRIARPH